MKCERCLNTDPKYFYHGLSRTYCRRCISLGGHQVDELLEIDGDKLHSELSFELTVEQKRASAQIARVGLEMDVLVEAVCGAGKTELVIELIHKALERGLHVGWMIARRQVVLQLTKRLQVVFSNQKVIAVCEGYTDDLQGHLVLLTAHQLYRYPRMFDVLIIDEPDAFPYKSNQLLHDLAQVACKKTKIYLTATPDKELLNLGSYHVKLNRRPHQRDLVVPKVIVTFKGLQYIYLLYYLKGPFYGEKVLIFVPTIKLANLLGKILRTPVLTSQSDDKQTILEKFSQAVDGKLICTTILERGMTFEEVFVIVVEAHHSIFDESSLIQISGRVGRSFDKTKGECLFLATKQSREIEKCLSRIKQHNIA